MKVSVSSWVLACRPKTLTASLVPIGVGTTLAMSLTGDPVRWSLVFFAWASSLFIQVGTNLINDVSDFERGADTVERLGPQRVTQSGLLLPRQVWFGAVLCFSLAVAFALPLVLAAGWPIVWIGIFSLMAGYAYTAGPFPLAYRGFGDLFVLIFFGWVAVGGMAFLAAGAEVFGGTGGWAVGVAGAQVGLLATALIAINNLRDYRTDLKVGKKTLAVRLGPNFARLELAFIILFPFVLSVYWILQGWLWVAYLPLFLFPIAFSILREINRTEPSSTYNVILGKSAILHLLFGLLLSAGMLIQALWV